MGSASKASRGGTGRTARDATHPAGDSAARPAPRSTPRPGPHPRPVRRAVLVASLAAVALGGCTWDPHAAQRSSSSSSGAPEPTGPSASSVSHEVTPSSPTGSPDGTASGAPSGRPTGSSSDPSPTSGTSRPTGASSADPFGSSSRGPRPGADPDLSGEFDPDLPRATGAGTGEEVGTLADVALSSHDGFDRVVLELEGPDVPTWEARYVTRALGDPSGEPVAVDGDAVLQVLLEPVAYPEDGGAPYQGPRRISRTGTTAVAQVVLSTFFEGELQVFVGVTDEPRPFRVYGMTDPARIVVEVERS